MRLKILIPFFAFCKANCDPGTTEGVNSEGMTTCTDIDECEDGTHTCSTDAKCVNKYKSFDCVCNQG